MTATPVKKRKLLSRLLQRRRNNMKPNDDLIIAPSKILSGRPVIFGINLLQGNGSFVVTDSSTEMLEFKKAGYDIRNYTFDAIEAELKEK